MTEKSSTPKDYQLRCKRMRQKTMQGFSFLASGHEAIAENERNQDPWKVYTNQPTIRIIIVSISGVHKHELPNTNSKPQKGLTKLIDDQRCWFNTTRDILTAKTPTSFLRNFTRPPLTFFFIPIIGFWWANCKSNYIIWKYLNCLNANKKAMSNSYSDVIISAVMCNVHQFSFLLFATQYNEWINKNKCYNCLQ